MGLAIGVGAVGEGEVADEAAGVAAAVGPAGIMKTVSVVCYT